MSANVALTERDQHHTDLHALLLDRELSQHGEAESDRRTSAQSVSDVRARSGFLTTARSLAVSIIVIGITILLFAFATISVPKLSPLSSIIVVAVFATLIMMSVAVAILVRDDQVEQWSSNLFFIVVCAMFFTAPIAFVAFVHCDQELLAIQWNALRPERRAHMTDQLNHLRHTSALTEDQAGLVIVAEGATISSQFSIICWVFAAIQVAILFPLYMMKFHNAGRIPPHFAASVTQQLQAAGLL